MNAHSPLAPSSAYRWVVCPGSVSLSQRYPEIEEGEAAAEGTASHWAGSEQLLGLAVHLGSVAPNGIVLTQEMLDGAQLWYDVVGGPNPELQVEQRVAMPRIHAAAFGTPDTWRWFPADGILRVWDYKYGFGIVEAPENWQCIQYTCGILDLLGIDGRNDQVVWVEIIIIQPRAPHPDGRVRTWRVRASDLRAMFNKLAAAADEAMGSAPRTVSGTHCLHCPAAAHCETLKRSAYAAGDYLGDTTTFELDAAASAYELQLLEHLEALVSARLKARTADIESRLKRGQSVTGFALEPSYGRRTWRDHEEVILMGDLLGVELRKPAEAITPNQAKKIIDKDVIDAYAHTPTTGTKLVRDTRMLDKARASFGTVINLE